MAKVDGQTVQIGDVVCFKSDFEQTGRIVRIQGDILTLASTSDTGFSGDYIGGSEFTTEYSWDCWFD